MLRVASSLATPSLALSAITFRPALTSNDESHRASHPEVAAVIWKSAEDETNTLWFGHCVSMVGGPVRAFDTYINSSIRLSVEQLKRLLENYQKM